MSTLMMVTTFYFAGNIVMIVFKAKQRGAESDFLVSFDLNFLTATKYGFLELH